MCWMVNGLESCGAEENCCSIGEGWAFFMDTLIRNHNKSSFCSYALSLKYPWKFHDGGDFLIRRLNAEISSSLIDPTSE
ncbi:hypothetical protein AB6A40_008956 [Gnathostoma spinigerum]|uniref:Uncharacterized protein n=1 Tax=Gnathostoma spinigerum TaxID=75299 RepID=A0ABD6EZM5_9BILA